MYVKLFASLYQGTLRGKSDEILVFTNLLAHADQHGVVDKHFRAIAEETGLSRERVEKAIEQLEAPDPESRSPEMHGCRIVKLDEHRLWGWQIVNYGKYRSIKNEDDRREQNRLAQERFRERHRPQQVSKNKQSKPRSAQAEAEADGEGKGQKKKPPATTPNVQYTPPPHLKDWADRSGYGETFDLHLEHFRDYIAQPKNAKRYVDFNAAFRSCLRADWGGIRAQLERKRLKLGGGPEPAKVKCGNCQKELTGGWTQSPRGRACKACYEEYRNGKWS